MVTEEWAGIPVYTKLMLDYSKKRLLLKKGMKKSDQGLYWWKEEEMVLCWEGESGKGGKGQTGSSNRCRIWQARPSSHLIWYLPNTL